MDKENTFKVGDKVIKNPNTWVVNDFDGWGRGNGTGRVVEPPFPLEDDTVDVRWDHGRCFEAVSGLTPWVDPDPLGTLVNSRVFNYYFSEGEEVMLDTAVMNHEQLTKLKDYIGRKAIVTKCSADLHAFGQGSSYTHEVSFDGIKFQGKGYFSTFELFDNIPTWMLTKYKNK